MLTVRFNNGLVVDYKAATFVEYRDNVWILYTCEPSKGGMWIASIPNTGCIVETVIDKGQKQSILKENMRIVEKPEDNN